jgi:aminoglycoside phosphotransferase (APT) family kinase protein
MSGISVETLKVWLNANGMSITGKIELTPLAGGQSNPTFKMTADGQEWVLRKKPPGVLLAAAHAVEREFRVMKALANTDVPVPDMIALCMDESVIGSAFYIMSFAKGRVFMDPTLPGFSKAERGLIYAELRQVAAAIHSLQPGDVGLADFGKSEGYLKRQIERWSKQYRASETEHIASMEQLMQWLPENLPKRESAGLVHGDFRIDNVIFHPTEPRAIAVIDWELSTLGDPLVDFAYHCMSWYLTSNEFRGIKDFDLAALGIPDVETHVQGWTVLTGIDQPSDWNYFLVYNMFRMAAILQGILARSRQGNASASDAESTGRRARLIADAGWRLIDK